MELARRAGHDVDRDDLCAALGMNWSPVAVVGERDIGRWAFHARDAFVIEAGRLFGYTIRDLHPPEAARGLDQAAEFAQHFNASYRPLIRRALEHQQPVLAWRGWTGQHALCWGVVRDVANAAAGQAEVFLGHGDSPPCATVALTQSPVQVYVVERIAAQRPSSDELADRVLHNVRSVLENALAGRFGVATGVRAYDLWIQRLEETRRSSEVDAPRLASHRLLAAATLAGCESLMRCLERHRSGTAAGTSHDLEKITSGVREIAGHMRIAADAEAGIDSAGEMRAALARAREATRGMLG